MPFKEDVNALEDALIDAFDLPGLKLMLRRQLGIVLEDEVNIGQGKKYIISDLVQVSNRGEWRDDLIRGALAQNGQNLKLNKVAQTSHVGIPARIVGDVSRSILVQDLEQDELEKLAHDRGVSIRFQDYAGKLNAMAKCMCRIEAPSGHGTGTGWLVAPGLILTNFHVIEGITKHHVTAADVTCRFDYFEIGAAGVECGLAEDWLQASSPYALADIRADAPQPTADELDYALIRLARPVSDEETGSGKRGFIAIRAIPPVAVAEDIMMVPQFPDGRSLELSFGKVLRHNDSGTRIRYDANTEPGASGSPVLTMALEPFGLHHAGGLGRRELYNQCVPLRLVLQHMIKNQTTPFWQ